MYTCLHSPSSQCLLTPNTQICHAQDRIKQGMRSCQNVHDDACVRQATFSCPSQTMPSATYPLTLSLSSHITSCGRWSTVISSHVCGRSRVSDVIVVEQLLEDAIWMQSTSTQTCPSPIFYSLPVTHPSECRGGKGVGSEDPEIECRAWTVPDCAGRGGMKVVANGVEEKAIGTAARNYLLLFL